MCMAMRWGGAVEHANCKTAWDVRFGVEGLGFRC